MHLVSLPEGTWCDPTSLQVQRQDKLGATPLVLKRDGPKVSDILETLLLPILLCKKINRRRWTIRGLPTMPVFPAREGKCFLNACGLSSLVDCGSPPAPGHCQPRHPGPGPGSETSPSPAPLVHQMRLALRFTWSEQNSVALQRPLGIPWLWEVTFILSLIFWRNKHYHLSTGICVF